MATTGNESGVGWVLFRADAVLGEDLAVLDVADFIFALGLSCSMRLAAREVSERLAGRSNFIVRNPIYTKF